MRSLVVALVAPNIRRRDGQGRVMVEIARALASRGHRAIAYSSSCAEELLSLPSFTWRRVPLPPGPEGFAVTLWAFTARRALASERHDVTCLMGGCTLPRGKVAYYAPFAQRTWQSIRTQTTAPGVYQKVWGKFAVWLEAKAVRRASSVIPMTSVIKEELAPLISAHSLVEVISPGVDLAEFPVVTTTARSDARRELGLSEDDFVVAFVGEYGTGRKGLDLLANAVALRPNGRMRVLVHGHGPIEKVRRNLRALGVLDAFGFPDPEIPVPHVMAASNAVVVPSTYEPFSLVALEAASSHLPVIVSKYAGAAAVLGDAALSVDPFDSEALRDAIDRVRDDEALALTLSDRARAVAEKMTWEIVSGQVVDVIEKTAH